ncbi:MAG: hypothetical protein GY839_07065 [candidate division Zixibacteria bacterium]|nr:hypothetical protein [candidate division Zixibacteria bacterium]
MFKYDPNYRLAALAINVKFFWAICLSIVILFTNSIPTQLTLVGLLLCLAFYGGLKANHLFKYLGLFWPVFSIVFVLHLFYHDGEIIFRIWLLNATYSGLFAGIFNLLRFMNFLLVAICFFSWASPLDISRQFARGIGRMGRKFFQDMALVFFIAMRFMPVLVKEREIVKMAMKARGANFGGGFVNKVRMNLSLLLPIFSRIIGQTDDVASTLALKGNNGVYFAGEKAKSKGSDILLILTGLALTVGIIYFE